jgi:hypothetical protein
MRNRPVGGIRRESKAAALEGIKKAAASVAAEPGFGTNNLPDQCLVLAVPTVLAV